MCKLTAHSEYGRLKSVMMKRPHQAFMHQQLINEQWEALNYLEAPSMERAVNEHQNLEQMLAMEAPDFHFLPLSNAVTLDSVYCRDASLVTDFGVILCRMGKKQRAHEPEEERHQFERMGVEILGTIEAPGTLEGGDVAWLDETTLAVGHTYRTNSDGINQLEALLRPKGIDVLIAEMPHYRGPADVFHLMSVLSPVDRKKAVVYSPLMPIHFRQELLDRDFELIEVPDVEFESMGCNVLAIAPSRCVIVAGNPVTQQRMEAAGCEVLPYEGQHISVLGGGGPTCLTRPIWRELA